ncbi:hypothetical protein BXY85_1282 [Roseivirga pacifica]|uniref:Uncharacterized protein n=1 Tax=Roseivirga pacifica TaxID=1267423 RepID=A0A1I0MBK0_9BACT|nr:hypothetical protein BXY85_1282 [Roseivirga pacifica]SEV85875.1 hypothetical protein SAMN05216290_0266 [Roseivirga pacifica]
MIIKLLISLACVVSAYLSVKQKARPLLTLAFSISILLGWLSVYSLLLYELALIVLSILILKELKLNRWVDLSALTLVVYSMLTVVLQLGAWSDYFIVRILAVVPLLGVLYFSREISKTATRYCILMIWINVLIYFFSVFKFY